jgi:hypothetical protein
MWKLRREQTPAFPTQSAGVRFGIGVQVVVRLDRSAHPDSVVEDPVGVIVAPGELVGSQFYAPSTSREAVWEVQFDEPFWGLDGSGPHQSARVSQSYLEAAPNA